MAMIVYAVARRDDMVAGAPLGLQNARCIPYGDLVAIVSTIPNQEWSCETHVAVPVASPKHLETDDEAVELLKSAHDAFNAILLKIAREVSFGLKAYWVREPSPTLTEFDGTRDRVRRAPYCRAIREALRAVSVKYRASPRFGNDMVLHMAFNVRRGSEPAFRAEVQRLTQRYPELTLRLTGPWPPVD